MRIYLGSQAFSPNSRGIARYSLDLYDGLSWLESDVHRHPKSSVHTLDSTRGPIARAQILSQIPGWPPDILTGLSRDVGDRRMIRKLEPDLLHLPYYPTGPFPPGRRKLVVTLHDMIHQKFPKRFNLVDRGRRTKYSALQQADLIICVSETTRKDLTDFWPEFAQKSIVVRNGIALADKPTVGHLSRPRQVLYVGSRAGHKNFDALSRAFGRLSGLPGFSDVELHLFGGPPLARREKLLFEKFSVSPDRVQLRTGGHAALNAALGEATCLVCPSEYEGFGYTPLEAMNRGCPVVISDTPALTEISGPAASVFELADPDGLLEGLRTLLTSEEERKRLSKLGLEHVKQFSYRRMASETLEAYKSI